MLPSEVTVAVVGGGPAGFMAAISAAEALVSAGQPVSILVLEATGEPLHKVLISGGGRCNVTHACWEPQLLVNHYPRGRRALRGPFAQFAPADSVEWFARHGLELVQEADGRLFPRSNRSSSVVECLRQAARRVGVQLATGVAVQSVRRLPQGGFELILRAAPSLVCRRLVLATGSHPSGHRLAAALGHSLVAPVPSLFSLALAAPGLQDLAGVSMDPVELELLPPADAASAPRRHDGQRQRGAVLITHRGLSGPATLRLTAFAARALRGWGYRAQLRVDWTGGLGASALEALFAQTRQQQARRTLASWRPWPGLARRLWWRMLADAGLASTDAQVRWAELTRRGQQNLIAALLNSRYTVVGRGPFGEEFVTAGGVPVDEVNWVTLESRRCEGLQLVGELLDIDGVTGGFNFQHCWTSGWLAGQALQRALMASSSQDASEHLTSPSEHAGLS
ncbi:MAG: NAD(P)/FAD-dependent oxidoreductase [Synechococcaceae cyanobacterium]|nr:NAD(P)/FAD-dependent oxidoreductase [Synechococcaceae cyanobacterium]